MDSHPLRPASRATRPVPINALWLATRPRPMTDFETLRSPLILTSGRLHALTHRHVLDAEELWWKNEGVPISDEIDRAGTPWLRMFDRLGKRVDEILYPPEYQTILRRGYRAGVIWRALEEKSLIPTYLLMYGISFY